MSDLEVGRVKAVLEVDDSKLRSALSNARRELDSFDKSASKPINLGNFFGGMDKLESEAIRSSRGMGEKFSDGFISGFGKGRGEYEKLGANIADSIQDGMSSRFGMMGDVATALGPAGMIATAMGLSAVAIEGIATKMAMNWQAGMTNIKKSTGLAGDDLRKFSDELLNFSTKAPIDQGSLQQLVARAGSLGVGANAKNDSEKRAQLMAFTKDAASMSVAFDMTAEDAATMASQVSRSFKLPLDEVHHLGSAITTVGDQLGVPEKQVMDFMNRAAGSSLAVKQGAVNTMAFGSALMSTGMQAEVAGSMLTMLESQVLSNDTRMKAWADTMGITVDQLKAKLAQDLYGTVLQTGDKLSKMESFAGIKAGTDIFGAEVAKYITKANGLGESYYGAVDKGNVAMKEGSRLAEVFGEKGADAAGEMTKTFNAAAAAAIDLGSVGLPAVTAGLKSVGETINVVRTLAKDVYGVGEAVGTGIGSAGKGVVSGGQGLSTWLNKVTGGALGVNTMAGVTYGASGVSEAEAQATASMHQIGDASGSLYIAGMATGIEKQGSMVHDAVAALGVDLFNTSKDAGAKAGALTGEAWVKAYGDAAEKGMTQIGGKWTSSDSTFYTNAEKFTDLFGRAFYMQTAKEKGGGKSIFKILDESGKQVGTEERLSSLGLPVGQDLKSYKQTVIDEAISPIVIDSAKFIKTRGDDISNALADVLSDGVVEGLEEKPLLNSLTEQIDQLELKLPAPEFEASNLPKLREDIEKSLQGIKIDVSATVKSVWEDWTSSQYKAQWTYENKDWLKQLTPGGRDELLAENEKQSRLLESTNAQERITAQNYFGALEGIKTGMSDQTLQSQAYFDQSLVTLEGIAPALAAVLNSWAGTYARASAYGQGMEPGKSFFDWSYKPQYSQTGYTKMGNALLNQSFMTALPKFGRDITYFNGRSPVLGIVGDSEEYMIPVESIKGLYPKSDNARKGSLEYYSGDRWFEDYPYKINAPASYQWSKYPNAPGVSFSGSEPTSWLSDQQKGGNEWISSQIRALQLASIGNSQVRPFFARGLQDQPGWWSSAASSLSPGYANVWDAQKGGIVPRIGADDLKKAKQYIYDPREDACIQVSDGAGLGLVTTDPFWLKRGATAPDGYIEKDIRRIAENTEDTSTSLFAIRSSALGMGNALSGAFPVYGGGQGGQGFGNMIWKDRSGAVLKYDTRTDTCDTLGFVAPDPSLKTTDPFYLGLTKDNPMGKAWEEGGWGGIAAQPGNEDLARQMEEVARNTDKTAENTQKQNQYWQQLQSVGQGSMIYGAGGGGAGGYLSLYGRNANSFWGGTSINGMGGWVGTGASMGGWGAQAVGGATGSFGGSQGWGSVQWAEGDIVSSPTFGVRGEAGREALVPLDNKAAGWRILRQILPEFGIRPFASGGIVGGVRASAVGNVTINAPVTILEPNMSRSELKAELEAHTRAVERAAYSIIGKGH